MKRIEDVEKPVIGRYYDVPCVKASYPANHHHSYPWPQGQFVPVIGGIHEDSEVIGFGHDHFHPDTRFMPVDIVRGRLKFKRHIVGLDGVTTTAEAVAASIVARPVIYFDRDIGVVRLKQKMRRQHVTFPHAPWTKRLEEKYAGRVAKCMTCPHRGISLQGAPRRGGKLICPGHGLAFDPETLQCVPRGRR